MRTWFWPLVLLLLVSCASPPPQWKLPLDARQVLREWLLKLREPTPSPDWTEPPLVAEVEQHGLDVLLGVPVSQMTVRVQAVPLELLANGIGELLGIGMVLSAEVKETVAVDIVRRPWPGVLRALTEVRGINLQVYPDAVLAWLHPDEIVRLRNLRAENVLRHSTGRWHSRRIAIHHADPKTLLGQLRELNRNLFNDLGATVDERTRALVLQGPEVLLNRLVAQVAILDRRERQMLIEAYIVEIARENTFQFGAAVAVDNKRVRGTADTGRGLLSQLSAAIPESGLAVFSHGGKLRLQLEALEREGLTRILSNPRIFVLNGERAEVFEGSEIPYSTVSDRGTQTQFREAGLKLKVLPRLYGTEFVNLEVQVSKDTVDLTRTNPPITRRHIHTRLLLRHGETLVIGGIYSENRFRQHNRVPWLSKIPLLGRLFGRLRRERGASELLVFLRPRLI